ncbi:MAG: hypothetical protein KatS3mg023_3928 [Armatimonadota bacterium]|nr:MAG: hypothetical protein KatS3mg023_3928 [Armatimonadota bacterium]
MWKSLLNTLKRALTLPARYNSVSDVRSDPAGAIAHLQDVVRSLQFYVSIVGKPEAYDTLSTIYKLCDVLRAQLEDRHDES